MFVSYVKENSATVLALTRELRALGHSTWTFQEDGVGGQSYLEEIHDAVSACRVFLLIASKTSVRSHQVLKEVELAHGEQRIIIPVLLDLTPDEFRSAEKILKVATGTTVPLNARDVDCKQLAVRIHATLEHRGLRAQETAVDTPPPEVVETKCSKCDGKGGWASFHAPPPDMWFTCKQCNGTGRREIPRG